MFGIKACITKTSYLSEPHFYDTDCISSFLSQVWRRHIKDIGKYEICSARSRFRVAVSILKALKVNTFFFTGNGFVFRGS